jgi:hypothetical protein
MTLAIRRACASFAIVLVDVLGVDARVGLAQTPAATSASQSAAPTSPAQIGKPPPLSQVLEGVAKRDYEIARMLFADGDYAGATRQFESAYEHSAEPRLLWDAAVSEKNRRHYASAFSLVSEYLEDSATVISSEESLNAQSFIDTVIALTAPFELDSDPQGAFVYVDGEELGPTPLGPPMRIDIGIHQVVVRKDGFNDYTATLTVSGSEKVHVRASLKATVRTGRLLVSGRTDAMIVMDGRPVGVGSWDGLVPVGPHVLQVTAPNAQPFRSDLRVGQDETLTVDARLEPLRRSGLPTWAWVVGGTVIAAGAAVAGYFLFRPSDQVGSPVAGSIATVHLR